MVIYDIFKTFSCTVPWSLRNMFEAIKINNLIAAAFIMKFHLYIFLTYSACSCNHELYVLNPLQSPESRGNSGEDHLHGLHNICAGSTGEGQIYIHPPAGHWGRSRHNYVERFNIYILIGNWIMLDGTSWNSPVEPQCKCTGHHEILAPWNFFSLAELILKIKIDLVP